MEPKYFNYITNKKFKEVYCNRERVENTKQTSIFTFQLHQ